MTSIAPAVPAGLITAAAEQAETAAAASGVRVTTLSRPADCYRAATLLQEIWQSPLGHPIAPETLVALGFTGNYASAAFLGDEMIGVSAGFRTDRGMLHSHIAGVLPQAQGRSIGAVLKMHQRAWALARGITGIDWTFDPLVRRNAHFNLITLGTRVAAYLPDFYGAMVDAFNPGDTSDRLLVEWDLTRPFPARPIDSTGAAAALTVGPDGEPVPAESSGPLLTVSLPASLAEIAGYAPGASARWRLALRRTLPGALAAGYEIVGMDAEQSYVLRRKD